MVIEAQKYGRKWIEAEWATNIKTVQDQVDMIVGQLQFFKVWRRLYKELWVPQPNKDKVLEFLAAWFGVWRDVALYPVKMDTLYKFNKLLKNKRKFDSDFWDPNSAFIPSCLINKCDAFEPQVSHL